MYVIHISRNMLYIAVHYHLMYYCILYIIFIIVYCNIIFVTNPNDNLKK